MRRLFFVFALLVSFALAPNAQSQTIGGGLALGGTDDLGLQFGGYFDINEQFSGGGDLVYYFVDPGSFYTINFNGRYLIREDADIAFYALAGLNHARASAKIFGETDSPSDTGLNLGGGVEWFMDQFILYAEPRIALGGEDQLVIAGGVRYRLGSR